jgi:ABC-2 type transport system ATP-binding protein
MDEPTNGLDIPSKSLFRKVVAQNVTEGSTLIISTHQVHDLESLLDHIIILDNSHILVNSSVADITGKYTFSFRSAQEMDDVLYAEPSFQGNAAISLRKPEDEETTLNLELFFNAATKGRLNY